MSNNHYTLLDYLEKTARLLPDKVMYIDEQSSITFGEFLEKAKRLGHCLREFIDLEVEPEQKNKLTEDDGFDKKNIESSKKGIALIIDKSIKTPLIYAAVLYAGSFYLPIDTALPLARKKQLLEIADTSLLLVATSDSDNEELGFNGKVLTYEKLEELSSQYNENYSNEKKDSTTDCVQTGEKNDPLCVIFTSGSTGTPKGVTLSHSAVLKYLIDFAEITELVEDDRLANQSPPDYVAALRDFYFPFICGVSTVLVPKKLFSIPVALFEYLNEHHVTTLYWVAPVLSYCADFNVFETVTLDYVKKVIFTGSVLPPAHLRYWQENLKETVFVNHYGPTEATATVSYYRVGGEMSEDQGVIKGETTNKSLPIGIPLPGVAVELLDEEGSPVKSGEVGEIFVRGSGLAIGYWRDSALSENAFPMLTIDGRNPERYFRTGDMGRLLTDGNLAFHGRKDSQVKLMGHRVELAEINNVATDLDGIEQAICVYEEQRKLLVLFYTGEAENKFVAKHLRVVLPDFMVPRRFCKLESIPLLPGGKPDMQELISRAKEA